MAELAEAQVAVLREGHQAPDQIVGLVRSANQRHTLRFLTLCKG